MLLPSHDFWEFGAGADGFLERVSGSVDFMFTTSDGIANWSVENFWNIRITQVLNLNSFYLRPIKIIFSNSTINAIAVVVPHLVKVCYWKILQNACSLSVIVTSYTTFVSYTSICGISLSNTTIYAAVKLIRRRITLVNDVISGKLRWSLKDANSITVSISGRGSISIGRRFWRPSWPIKRGKVFNGGCLKLNCTWTAGSIFYTIKAIIRSQVEFNIRNSN